jgi:hypothetical protein
MTVRHTLALAELVSGLVVFSFATGGAAFCSRALVVDFEAAWCGGTAAGAAFDAEAGGLL